MIPPGVLVVDDEVPLMVAYGTLVTRTELVKPLEALVGFKEKELDTALVLVLVPVNEMDELTGADELVWLVPVGAGREVEFQIPVLVGYGGMEDEPVPAGTLEVVFQRPVLLGYSIEDKPVTALGPCV